MKSVGGNSGMASTSASSIPSAKGIIVLKEYAEPGQEICKHTVPVVTSSTNPVSFATSRQHFNEDAPDTTPGVLSSSTPASTPPKSRHKFERIGPDRAEQDRLAAARADAQAQARLANYGKAQRAPSSLYQGLRAEGDDDFREEGDDYNLELLGPD